MEQRTLTGLAIQHPNEPNCQLVGLLEQIAPTQPTQGRKIALILHGTLGHKDYLFQKSLASSLPLDSFRFDFRGNHESGGPWKQSPLAEDLEDLEVVSDHLKDRYGYVIDLVVGHSKGSIVGFRWMATSEHGKTASAYVNVSGRYRMEKFVESKGGKSWVKGFEENGYFEWDVTVARKPMRVRVTPEDMAAFIAWDTSFVWNEFPQHADVLTIHGLKDEVVPPYDAVIYTRALSNRNPGTTTLHFVEDADHNFTAHKQEVVDTILRWWDQRGQGNLQPVGISLTEIKALL